MTRLLIIRHGQSEANKNHIFAGHFDAPLSELGCAQAERTACYIAENYRVSAVYASDLQRAYHTGRAVADRLGLDVVTDEQLREIYAGEWEGVTFEELAVRYPEEYGLWRFDIGLARCVGGESLGEVWERAVRVARRIAKAHVGQTVVLATHATVTRALQCEAMGVSLPEMKNVPYVSNASVTVIDVDEDGKLTLIEAGHDAHMDELKSVLPPNV